MAAVEKGKMEDLIPGMPHLRPERVVACANRTREMTANERRLAATNLLAGW